MPDRSALKIPAASAHDAKAQPHRIWSLVVVGVLMLAAVGATLTRVSNFDVFWHLASGRWMIEHGRVLDFDPFSIDPQTEWINVHWGFQVIVALLHSVGGFEALSVLKAALGAAVIGVFAVGMRREVPRGWLIFSGLGLLCMIVPRVRVRPEVFTLVFLMVTIILLEGVRRGGPPRRLWWAVPLMLVWVNMHGLYVLGLGVIWASVIGAWIDRRMKRESLSRPLLTHRALGPILAATVAVLVSPWPLEAALHPILLWTRVSGRAFYYTYGVAELQPTWSALANHPGAILLVLLVAGGMIGNRKQLPASHAIWLVAFTGLGLLARRNVGLGGPVVGYLLAFHGGALLRRVGARRPDWKRWGSLLTAGMIALTVLVTLATASSWIWRKLDWRERRFGAGLLTNHYPIETAKFLAELPAEGDLLCDNFGDAGTFIYHSSPRRRVYMDGRLEVHSPQRFEDQYRITTAMRTPKGAETVELHRDVRFVFVRHDSGERLAALVGARRWRLIHLEPTGACFADARWSPPPTHTDLPQPNFEDFDRPLGRDGLVDGFPSAKRRLYAQNPSPTNYQLGAMLLSLGQYTPLAAATSADRVRRRCTLLAIRYLTAAQTEDLMPSGALSGMAAKAYLQRALRENAVPSMSVPVDMNLVRALVLYRRVDLSRLEDPSVRAFAQYQIVTLKAAGQTDLADEAMRKFLAHLPPRDQVLAPRDYLELRDEIRTHLDRARERLGELDREDLPLLQRIDRLTSPEVGLMRRATAELQGRPAPTSEVLFAHGDLLLRQGRVREARRLYSKAAVGAPRAWESALREALCDWAEGRFFPAADAMSKLTETSDEPIVRYYLAVLLEQLGRYEEAKIAIAEAHTTDASLGKLVERIRRRLEER